MKYDTIEILQFLGEKITVNILKYLEANSELLKKPHFECAYRIARTAFVKRYFARIGLDMVENCFRDKLDSIKLDSTEIENSKKDTYYLADLVKRYGISSDYIDLLDGYMEL